MGHKKTRRELVETTRNETARHYQQLIRNLEARLAENQTVILAQTVEISRLEERNALLTKALGQKDSTVSTLTDLLGLDEKGRRELLQAYHTREEFNRKMDSLSRFESMLSGLFL